MLLVPLTCIFRFKSHVLIAAPHILLRLCEIKPSIALSYIQQHNLERKHLLVFI